MKPIPITRVVRDLVQFCGCQVKISLTNVIKEFVREEHPYHHYYLDTKSGRTTFSSILCKERKMRRQIDEQKQMCKLYQENQLLLDQILEIINQLLCK